MAQTLTLLLTHGVFSTKDRVDLITPQVEPHLYNYIGAVCKSNKSPLLPPVAPPTTSISSSASARPSA